MFFGFFIIAVLFSIIILLCHFKFNNKYLLWVILFQFLILANKNLNKPFLNEWDEQYHALVAKNLTSNYLEPTLYKDPILPFDFKAWNRNHIWLHKPPLTLWFMSASISVFGNTEFAVRLPSLIFSLLSIVLSFKIILKLFDLKTALIVAYFQSISGFLLELSGGIIASDHVDTLFIFIIETGVFTFLYFAPTKLQKRIFPEILIMGLITALALLTKWLTGYFILLLFGLYMYLNEKQNVFTIFLKLSISFIISVLAASLWYYFAFTQFKQEFLWEQLYNFKHFNQVLEGHSQAWWYFIDNARIRWNELIYIIYVYFIYKTIKNKFQPNHVFMHFWIIVPYIIFSFAKTKMPAYIAISAPAVFYMMALFCQDLWYNFSETKFKLLFKILAVSVFLLNIRYSIERTKPFHSFEEISQKKNRILQLEKYFTKDKPNIIFGNDDSIRTMFYLDCISYSNFPSLDEIHKLTPNYHIIVLDNHRLSIELRKNRSVTLVDLK